MEKFIDVPVIDVSPLLIDSDLSAKNMIADQISVACRGSGFFYISNHGIDICKLQSVVYNFFNTITNDEKFKIAVNAYNKNSTHKHLGYYLPIPDKKLAERFIYSNPNFTDKHPLVTSGMREVNIWPDSQQLKEFRIFCERYYWDMFNLASKLLHAFALSLGKNQQFFDQYLTAEDNLSAIAFIKRPFMEKYPEVQKDKNGTKICFGEHKDVSLISIAFQTPIANVQVKINGEYFDIPASDEYLLVHCGSYMSYITYDYFPAVDHRVRFVNAERLCLPFFVDLDYEAKIEPFLPYGSLQSAVRKPIKYGEYLEKARNKLLVKNGQI